MRRKEQIKVTRLSSSGSSLKKGLWSCSCWWTKFSMSTSKLAEVMHSDPCVACSHFSKSRARRGKRGCLQDTRSVNVVKYSHCKCMAVFRLTFYCITCTCVFLFYTQLCIIFTDYFSLSFFIYIQQLYLSTCSCLYLISKRQFKWKMQKQHNKIIQPSFHFISYNK